MARHKNFLKKEDLMMVNHNFSNKIISENVFKFSDKDEREILKVFLLNQFHQIFFELFNNQLKSDACNFSMECYAMDSKIIQLVIKSIVDTKEYTLEGISYHTHIPYDIIFDAACGINNQFSVTLWIRIVNLFMQVRPDIGNILLDRLLEIKNKNSDIFSSLLE
ncbi:MAG TPA: hypothetical protein VHM20_07470 [Gammaproteobacteria bacterium]|nr:hypothetical protein [Gammaproteobacteria bacterium]